MYYAGWLNWVVSHLKHPSQDIFNFKRSASPKEVNSNLPPGESGLPREPVQGKLHVMCSEASDCSLPHLHDMPR